MADTYRPNVGIVLFNDDKKVLVCERKGLVGQWQFPQGGIEKGETFQEAAYRELYEETSVVSVEPVAWISQPLKYDFPPEVATRFNKKGQAMNWALLRFVGSEEEINLNTAEPEFSQWKWVYIDEAVANIVKFKQAVYEKMATEFKPYIVGK